MSALLLRTELKPEIIIIIKLLADWSLEMIAQNGFHTPCSSRDESNLG